MKPVAPCLTLLCLASIGLAAETHRFVPSTYHASLAAAQAPAMRLKSGDRVVTSTVDEAGADATGTVVAQGPSALTGPFFVENAEPGDLLVVTLERLTPNRATGYSTSIMAPAAVPPSSLSPRQDPRPVVWTIDRDRGLVRLDLSASMPNVNWRARFGAPTIEMPLVPSLGSIGVAPAADAVPATASGPGGGTIVSAGLTDGARVMLPVLRPGALLYLGHGHARQGDGMATGTGIETSLDVEFKVEVVKKQPWPHSSVARPSTVVGEFEQGWPRVETSTQLMTIGSGATLEEALQRATLELHHWLDDDFGLSEQAVSLFLCQALELQVSQISHGAEPGFTVVAKVRKAYLPAAPGT
jgi:acetamidase/formamidase